MSIRICIAIVAAAIASGAVARETNGTATASAKAGTRSLEQLFAMKKTGGRIRTTFKHTKEIYIVNAQSRVRAEVLEASRLKLETAIRTPISTANGLFAFPNPKIEGELSLYVIDDPALPMSLVAPEGRWAFVNVAVLAKGRGEGPAFLEARTRKEIVRVASMLFGGIGSAYSGSLLSFMPDADALDRHESEMLPLDATIRMSHYLLELGVKPWRTVSYRRACEEGWAPAPTNEFQKAVWDEVHAIPSKPIKIEFDPKTDTK